MPTSNKISHDEQPQSPCFANQFYIEGECSICERCKPKKDIVDSVVDAQSPEAVKKNSILKELSNSFDY